MAFANDKRSPLERRPLERRNEWCTPLVRAILLAQGLSLLLCVMGTTSGLLAAHGVNMPTTQSFFNYLLLGITCGAFHLYKRGPKLSNPWYVYLLLAVLDVEANFLVTKAYQYTSVTSVTLLDCFTIPSVMALSALVLRARYLPGHYGGALLCIAGLAVLVATDGSSATGGPDPVLGDALVLLGSVLYACSNVAQERLLLGATPVSELLASVGTFGALIGGVQAVLLERGAWLTADWSDPWAVAAPLAGFALALYCFALLLPLVLMWSGATVLNLSLLTSDVWAAGARVVFFGGFGGTAGWFALSLVCEAAGLLLYTRAGQTHPHPGDPRMEAGTPGADGAAATAGSGAGGLPYQRISSIGGEGDCDSPDVEHGRRLLDPAAVAAAGAAASPASGARARMDIEARRGSSGRLAGLGEGSAARGDTVGGVGRAAGTSAGILGGLLGGPGTGRVYGVDASAEESMRLVDGGNEAESPPPPPPPPCVSGDAGGQQGERLRSADKTERSREGVVGRKGQKGEDAGAES